jgi:hypothetical protein
MYTEYKTFNIQEKLEGHTEKEAFYEDEITPVGTTLTLGNSSGSVKINNNILANSYRGIENPFGNLATFVDGINIDNFNIYISSNINDFNDIDNTNYIQLNIDLINTEGINIFSSDLYENSLIIKEAEEIDNYISDGIKTKTTGNVVAIGGSMDLGRYAGISYIDFSLDKNNSYNYVGSRSAVLI